MIARSENHPAPVRVTAINFTDAEIQIVQGMLQFASDHAERPMGVSLYDIWDQFDDVRRELGIVSIPELSLVKNDE